MKIFSVNKLFDVKFLPFAILLLILILLSLASVGLIKKSQSSEQEKAALTQSPSNEFLGQIQENKIFLPDFSLPNLYNENAEFSKKNLIGHYSVINFFASWCATCRDEHEALLSLQKDNIVKIYGIAWRDISQSTKKYLENYGNPFEIVALDSRGLFTKIIDLKAVPETLIVNPNGLVIARITGKLEPEIIERIKVIIQK